MRFALHLYRQEKKYIKKDACSKGRERLRLKCNVLLRQWSKMLAYMEALWQESVRRRQTLDDQSCFHGVKTLDRCVISVTCTVYFPTKAHLTDIFRSILH